MNMRTLLLIAIALFLSCSFSTDKDSVKDYTAYVDPLTGTEGYGHCFPNACVPFGMVQAGPQTGNCSWDYCAGYQYRDSTIEGFSQNRLNGTGIGDFSDLLILPFTDNDLCFQSSIDKKTELASPGYYSVELSGGKIKAEMTAGAHVAFHRYSFRQGENERLMIDFQNSLCSNKDQLYSHVLDAKVNVEDQTTISGYCHTKSWQERSYFYVIQFNHPFTGKTLLPQKDEREKAPRYVLDFDLPVGEPLMIKIALSSTSVQDAKENLEAELNHWDFSGTAQKAEDEWNNLLLRVDIEGNEETKKMFYTSMYRLFTQPNNMANAGEKPFYSTLSLWDTYRAAHPLYTLLSPEYVDDFVNSMIVQYDKQGFLPLWALWGGETYCMIGNHSVPVIVDAFLKGFNGFDPEKAYQAVKRSLTTDHPNSPWSIYMEHGYFPFDQVKNESVSKTLESAYDDYCAALFAKALGKAEDYTYFLNRSGFYENLFDPATKLMRGKDSSGKWRDPFNPFLLSHASTSGGDYTEGNAWQYTWHVQHDVKKLIGLMGGEDPFTTKLDSLFYMINSLQGSGFVSDVTGLIGQYAHGNEPSHHVAYLFALAGKPWRTQELVHEIMDRFYRNKPDGLCGNDDCGQMSAWYIFSAMGFYPVNPCGGEYIIGAPQLKNATIKLSGNKTFTVEAINFSEENIYVKSVQLNGKDFHKKQITHHDIINGGKLTFTMTSQKSNE
jgi:predicted alpha-1,2-mannosidase